jgi:phosphatidylserine/phosphatidylglycerophosphate/cardiolipin synthase-like enzyme
MKKFELQSPTEFIKDFQNEAKKAKRRIWIQTMYFETGKRTKAFEDALINAAKRKLDIQLVIDWSTRRHAVDKIHLYPIFPLSKHKREKLKQFSKEAKKMFKRLRDAGVKTLLANQPGVNGNLIPILRRNHSKIFIVDDIVWTGGINLNDPAFDNIDFMIKFKNPKIVNAIEKQFPQLSKNPVKDYLVDLDDDYRLLVDNGRYNRSIIYSHALKMIERAKEEIIFISQYVPDGALLKKLVKKANERVKVIIITSHKEHKVFTKFPYTPFYSRLKSRIKHNPYIKIVHCSKKVHAKLLEVDKKEVIFGSHNFVKTTIWFGTQEISIHSTDKKLIKTLDKFAVNLYKDHLGK